MPSITTSAASSIPAVVIAAFAIVISVLPVAVNSINAFAFVAFAPPLRHFGHQHHLHTSSWALLHRKRHRRPHSLPIPLENIATRSSITSSSSLENSSTAGADADAEQETIIMWDAQSQTYLSGIVPSHHDSSSDIDTLLSLNGDGKLKIFGYGSLCWHAGSEGGVLSLADREEEEEYYEEHEHHLIQDNVTSTTSPSISTTKRKGRVSTSPGMAIGYQRCWSQRSADHRGTPQFNGIVCTLLSDEEVGRLQYDEEEIIMKQEQHQQQPNPLHLLQPNSTSSSGTSSKRRKEASMTEGLIYTIDEDLVHECLAELDFREKGGYARDIIDVVEFITADNGSDTPTTASTVEKKYTKALLYRGTPENPAFWKRVMFDLPLAAAIISLAVGPSGPNDVYLRRLHAFLLATTHGQRGTLPDERSCGGRSGDVRTGRLTRMLELLQSDYRPYLMFGAGSNEHNQLLLSTRRIGGESDIHFHDNTNNGHHVDAHDCGTANRNNDEEIGVHYTRREVHELTEMLVVVPRMQTENKWNSEDDIVENEVEAVGVESSMSSHADHDPRSLHAGGGHSALLTHGGDLFLWGWNDSGQLGRRQTTVSIATPFSNNLIPPLSNIKVEVVALGHTHTIVIEKGSGHLYGFGEDSRGQVSGRHRALNDNATMISQHSPRRISIGVLEEESFIHVAAGLFHSAAITKDGGELITWGCGRFGQCLRVDETSRQADTEGVSTFGRWCPPDGCKLVQVACGRRHTVVLDEHGRVWTVGDNKYGQLGRHSGTGEVSSITEPQLVNGPLGQIGSGCFAIYTGWSHNLALSCDGDAEDYDRKTSVKLYGWGRNDKGQLGLGTQLTNHQAHVLVPQLLEPPLMNPSCKEENENSVHAVCCGAESSHVIDAFGNIYSTGWNEHGNLAIGQISHDGCDEHHYTSNWAVTTGADVVAPPPTNNLRRRRTIFAAGGAHIITSAS